MGVTSEASAVARRVLKVWLPPETSSTRGWEWAAAEPASRALLPELRRLRIPHRACARIEYDAEEAIRAALLETKARRALDAEIAHLAAVELRRGTTRAKVDAAVSRTAKKRVDAWRKARLAMGVARARKEIARGLKEERTRLSSIEKMDARALHRFANRWNWDAGAYVLDAVVRRPNCALGTALLVYWLAKPYWFAQWRSAKASDDPETFAMLAYIETRIAKGGYAHAGIAFDPRKEKLTSDTYEEEPKKRALPRHVFVATTKTSAVRFEPG